MRRQLTNRELRRLYQERFARDPAAPEPQAKPKESFGTRIFYAALVVAVIVASGLATSNFLAPLVVGMPQDVVIQPAALPTAAPPPAQQWQQQPAPAQSAPQAPPQEIAPPVVPQPPVAAPAPVQPPVSAPQAPVVEAAPVEAPPALPEPADPAFGSSFEYQADSANNPFVGCLPGRDCNPSYSQPTALPGPSDPGFKDSFK